MESLGKLRQRPWWTGFLRRAVILFPGGHAEGQGREQIVILKAPRGHRDRVDTVLGLAYF